MSLVIADISMSLDGYVTGPAPDEAHGLGRGGEALHVWAVDSDDEIDVQELRDSTDATGAVVMGRRLFDIVDGPHGWNDEMGYGAGLAAAPPFFVVTHAAPEKVRLDLEFTFVDSLPSAVGQARAEAGAQDTVVMGGAEVVRQSVEHGLVDQLRLHIAPVVLGAGTALFEGSSKRELVQQSVRPSAHAVHVTYSVKEGGST